MKQTPFDIVKCYGNGDLRWAEAVGDLETAKARVQALGAGKYIVLDQKTGEKTSIEVGQQGVKTLRIE